MLRLQVAQTSNSSSGHRETGRSNLTIYFCLTFIIFELVLPGSEPTIRNLKQKPELQTAHRHHRPPRKSLSTSC